MTDITLNALSHKAHTGQIIGYTRNVEIIKGWVVADIKEQASDSRPL